MALFTSRAASGDPQPRSRLSRSMPLVAGSVIAAGGLVFGALAAANAQSGSSAHSTHLTIAQQAKKVQRQDAHDPKNGNTTLNVNVLEDQIEHYYGAASATYPNVGTVTIPAKNSNYAKQMKKIVGRAQAQLLAEKKRYQGSAKPAVVFDIDDTLLNTYDYTLSAQFGYDPTTNAVYIDNAAFPAVFDMPHLVRFARNHGFSVFYITGRPESQRAATVKDLTSAGYAKPEASHLFLKPSTPPSYLNCAKAPSCTTIEYKSGTRKHIQSDGFKVLSDFGDQYSDLLGGAAGHQVKIPNPMYYLP